MNKIILLIRLIPKLGLYNVTYAFWYKLSLKFGLRKLFFKSGKSIQGKFYSEINATLDCPSMWKEHAITKANNILNGIFTWFSFHNFKIGEIPNWFYNPFENKIHAQHKKHWTEINDFGEGDIKIIWELSRFDWLTDLARAYIYTGETKYIMRINALISDWSENNPINIGPNWKCGQETSIRLMKLLTTAHLFDQLDSPSPALIEFVYQHTERIEGNIQYGIVQDNNHGSSEAIGLYIGASWLLKNQYPSTKLENWQLKGRALLEGRINKLIQADGSFSQRSTTYHRVIVDTLSFCLHMMQLLHEKPFDSNIEQRLIKLGEWQYKMTFGADGDAPNYGSNDGAKIENLGNFEYRDFRPSTQLFFALLTNERIYNGLALSEPMFLRCGDKSLSFPLRKIELPIAEILDQHILIMRNERAQLFLKIPDDIFRPGNDAFHIDLWIEGKPILIDAGTYSYNADQLTDKFKSVSSHNTVQFGIDEQMPKISRFLNGAWIKSSAIGSFVIDGEMIEWQGAYTDYKQNDFRRCITLSNHTLKIHDVLFTKNSANSNFHLVNDSMITWQHQHLESNNTNPKLNAEASLYYMEKHPVTKLQLKHLANYHREKVKAEFQIEFRF